MSLKRVAAVTGGSSGIGLAIVKRLQVIHAAMPSLQSAALQNIIFRKPADKNSHSHVLSDRILATPP
jgi:NAD(P)-dependent dehydrogenase (short-subunit alcohol dehydrogenase family)